MNAANALTAKFLPALYAVVLAIAGASPAQPQEQRVVSADELKGAIDGSLRWLRSQQDRETGSYGGDTLGTAWSVLAFAESPRAYRESDGPFLSSAVDFLLAQIGEDGFVGAGSKDQTLWKQRMDQSCATLRAFELLGGARLAAPTSRLRKALGELYTLFGEPAYAEDNYEVAGKLVAFFLEKRSPEGYWEGPRGRVVETANLLWELNYAHRVLAGSARAAATPGTPVKPLPKLDTTAPALDPARVERALEAGAAFLASQAPDGHFSVSGREDPGVTALAVAALAGAPGARDGARRAAIEGGLNWLAELQKEDGAIHAGALANYTTSAAILAMVRAGRPQDSARIARARDFLVKLQADEGEGYDSSDRYYGGVGYGGDERPDLSNLQMALEAMSAAGLADDDPAFSKALRFLERTQNRSESNDLEVVSDGVVIQSGDDGGAGYAPGESKAGFIELADGKRVTRSYGSMTYSLLKGYLFAGLQKDDPRVAAAWTWLMQNYTLDINPGFEASNDPNAGYQGLLYYFYGMARALSLWGEDEITDANGTRHLWRQELAGRLISMQRPDGSWRNENSPRWWEGDPVLATAYALLTVQVTQSR